MTAEAKTPIRLRNRGRERGGGRRGLHCLRRQREVDPCAARRQPQRAVMFGAQQFCHRQLSENVSLCVLELELAPIKQIFCSGELLSTLCKCNFLCCQLSCFVPLQIPYGCNCDQYDRCHCRKGQMCDALQARGTCP